MRPREMYRFHVAQLRHAYAQLLRIEPGIADGLISPAIAYFEVLDERRANHIASIPKGESELVLSTMSNVQCVPNFDALELDEDDDI